ncbi:MAG TPA: hypothetical protein VFT48_03250, partial [Pyrinomonadaceae bacterium]|nr:hypothetical protein [Pyrinomonadaceae bacterium]
DDDRGTILQMDQCCAEHQIEIGAIRVALATFSNFKVIQVATDFMWGVATVEINPNIGRSVRNWDGSKLPSGEELYDQVT